MTDRTKEIRERWDEEDMDFLRIMFQEPLLSFVSTEVNTRQALALRRAPEDIRYLLAEVRRLEAGLYCDVHKEQVSCLYCDKFYLVAP